MKTFAALLKREYWEHRFAFSRLPLILGGMFLFGIILFVTWLSVTEGRIDPDFFILENFAKQVTELSHEKLSIGYQIGFMALSTLSNMILMFVLLFYYLGSLLDDRKDRSILFWRSMPVSDTQSVLSKLVAGSLMTPLIWAVIFTVVYSILLVIFSVLLFDSGLSLWSHIWYPANPIRDFFSYVVAFVINAFWLFPLWTYCMMLSARAKGKVFLWFALPIAVVSLLQLWISNLLQMNTGPNLTVVIGQRFMSGTIPIAGDFQNDSFLINGISVGQMKEGEALFSPYDWSIMINKFAEPGMWYGLILGAVFLSVAIYLRRYANED